MATRIPSRQLQRGLTMIELLAALAISALIAASLVAAYRVQAENRREDAAAEHAKRVVAAVQDYTRDNYAAIVAGAGPTTPYTVTAATLAGSVVWPAGTSTNNAYGQSFVVKIIEPSTNRLEALVLYTGGESLSTGTLRGVANKIGLAGGYVAAEAPTVATGMMKSWSKALSAFGGNQGTGKVAVSVFAADAMALDDYLHRTATPGKPELNRMNTSIDMANNNIENGARIGAQNVDAANGIQANQIAIGKSVFGATPYPYETIQLANGFNMRMAIGTREHTVFQNDGSLVTHGNIASEANLSANGAVTAAGNISGTEVYARNWFRSQGSGGWYSEPYGGGFYMSDTAWIRAYNNKGIYTAGEIRGGGIRSTGWGQIDGSLQVNNRTTTNDVMFLRQENEGAGCSENGLTARTPAGKIVSCTNGVFRGGGGITNLMQVSGGQSSGPQWAYAECPAGWFLAGGGYNIVTMEKSSSQEAPQVNRPDGNRWAIYGGGTSGARESRWQVYATCLQ